MQLKKQGSALNTKILFRKKKIVLKSSSEFTDLVDETENSSLSSSRHVKFPNYFIQNVRFQSKNVEHSRDQEIARFILYIFLVWSLFCLIRISLSLHFLLSVLKNQFSLFFDLLFVYSVLNSMSSLDNFCIAFAKLSFNKPTCIDLPQLDTIKLSLCCTCN